MQFTEKGLSVDGVTEAQLDELFNTAVLKFCQDNEKEITSNVAATIVSEANALFKGKSLMELVDWLKHFIDGGK